MAEVKKEEKKNPLQKLKEAVDDKEEQLMYLATLIRVIVLVWSAGILTLNYVKIPGYDAGEKIDLAEYACRSVAPVHGSYVT